MPKLTPQSPDCLHCHGPLPTPRRDRNFCTHSHATLYYINTNQQYAADQLKQSQERTTGKGRGYYLKTHPDEAKRIGSIGGSR